SSVTVCSPINRCIKHRLGNRGSIAATSGALTPTKYCNLQAVIALAAIGRPVLSVHHVISTLNLIARLCFLAKANAAFTVVSEIPLPGIRAQAPGLGELDSSFARESSAIAWVGLRSNHTHAEPLRVFCAAHCILKPSDRTSAHVQFEI